MTRVTDGQDKGHLTRIVTTLDGLWQDSMH